jgi:hypothetical protein
VLTLLHALMAGGDCISDADVLRTDSTASVLGHQVMPPSTLGTFLRSFTFGHIRQLDRVAETVRVPQYGQYQSLDWPEGLWSG